MSVWYSALHHWSPIHALSPLQCTKRITQLVAIGCRASVCVCECVHALRPVHAHLVSRWMAGSQWMWEIDGCLSCTLHPQLMFRWRPRYSSAQPSKQWARRKMQKCVCVPSAQNDHRETNFAPSLPPPTRRSQWSRVHHFSVSLLQFVPFIWTVSRPDDRKRLLHCLWFISYRVWDADRSQLSNALHHTGGNMFGAQLVGSMGIMRIDLGWRLLAELKEICIHFSGWFAVSDAFWKAFKQHPCRRCEKYIYLCTSMLWKKLHLIFFFPRCFPVGSSTAQRRALPVTSKRSHASLCRRFGSGVISVAPLGLLELLQAFRLWCRVASFGRGSCSWGSQWAARTRRLRAEGDVYIAIRCEDMKTGHLEMECSVLEIEMICVVGITLRK